MKMVRSGLVAAMIASLSVVSAAEKLDFQLTDLHNVKANGNSLVTTSYGKAYCRSTFIKIDPTKKYKLSAQVRTTGGTEKSQIYFGFSPFTAEGKELHAANCNGIANTLTVLTAPAKKGDKVLKVKDGSKFWNRSWYCFALNAKADLSDLPNFKIVSNPVTAKKQVGDHWELTLARPLNLDIAAGTSIRQHAHGGFLYAAGSRLADSNWKPMMGTIKGQSTVGWRNNIWPKGTAKAQIILLVNYTAKKVITEVKDITLTVE